MLIIRRTAVLLLTSSVLVNGCASIVSNGPRTVTINSTPAGVPFVVRNKKGTDVNAGKTPATFTLEGGAGYFKAEHYTVIYRPEGGPEQQRDLNATLNGWYWGNLLFGGVIGMLIVDPATGAMWTLPKQVSADLSIPPAPLVPVPVVPATAPAAL